MIKQDSSRATAKHHGKVVNRRGFIGVTAASPLLVPAGILAADTHPQGGAPKKSASPAKDAGDLPILDYGLSFLSGLDPKNRVRFWVESRTRIIDQRAGRHEDFYQCASCKGEDTFAEKNLFLKDSYDFMPIFGPEDGIIFRRKAYLNPNYRQPRKAAGMWGGQVYRLRQARSVQLLPSNAEIRKATHEGLPLVAQTEISDSSTGLRAIIEFPVKTMNIEDNKNIYQVDTGPVAFPDLSRRYATFSDSLSLAFVAFNAPHFADFVIEDVTPIMQDGREVASVHHFSRMISLPARNRLYSISR